MSAVEETEVIAEGRQTPGNDRRRGTMCKHCHHINYADNDGPSTIKCYACKKTIHVPCVKLPPVSEWKAPPFIDG